MQALIAGLFEVFVAYTKTYNFVKTTVTKLLAPITDRFDLFDTLLIWTIAVIILTNVVKHIRRTQKYGLRSSLSNWFFSNLRKISFINKKIEQELDEMGKNLDADICKNRDPKKIYELPESGLSEEAIKNKLAIWQREDYKIYGGKKITGCLYYNESEKLHTLVKDISKDYLYINPLHFDLFPHANQIEGEIISMVRKLYNGDDEACGIITSGGTESIMTAMLSYREWGRQRGITDPEIVAPVTAHVAFDKAAFYYGMRVKHVKVDLTTGAVDPADMEAAISKDTVCLVGSYPNYPYGTCDPIEELGEIAQRHGLGLHTDCCLGGFVAPFADKFGVTALFDFRVRGVTSISVDPHKYGLAPKGVSVVLFRNRKLRLGSIYSYTNWPGGIYATPTHAGSRGLGPVAGAWVALMATGYNGYLDKAGKIIEATRRAAKKIQEIKEIQLVGKPELGVVSFITNTKAVNGFQLIEKMNKKGWKAAALQKPPGVHLAITNYNIHLVEDFVSTVKSSVAELVKDPPKVQGDLAQIYGSAAVLPENIIQDGVKLFIEALLKP